MCEYLSMGEREYHFTLTNDNAPKVLAGSSFVGERTKNQTAGHSKSTVYEPSYTEHKLLETLANSIPLNSAALLVPGRVNQDYLTHHLGTPHIPEKTGCRDSGHDCLL